MLIPLPHLNLATFPNDYQVVHPLPFIKKFLTIEQARLGGKYLVRTRYFFLGSELNPNQPYAYKEKLELFDSEGKRLANPQWNDKEKTFFTIYKPTAESDAFTSWTPKDFPPLKTRCYKKDEAIAFGKGKIVTVTEGEKDCETLRSLGIVAVSFAGKPTELSEIECDGFLYLGDGDEAGLLKVKDFEAACKKLKRPCLAVPISKIWDEAKPGSDITDFKDNFFLDHQGEVELENKFIELLKNLLLTTSYAAEVEQTASPASLPLREGDAASPTASPEKLSEASGEAVSIDKQGGEASEAITPSSRVKQLRVDYQEDEEDDDNGFNGYTESYTEKCLQTLYTNLSNPYISIDGEIYQFVGTHYQLLSKVKEQTRIAKWLRTKGKNYQNDNSVNQCWKWVCYMLAKDSDEVNPPGINTLDGVLRINWSPSGVGSVQLHPHSPSEVYTIPPSVHYDPLADDTDCLKMLSCLSEPERKIFLRTIAYSLDIPFIRAKTGRPRALLLEGTGSNGKDALRSVVATIFGKNMTNASLDDFWQASGGNINKFRISKLKGKSISWSSENSSSINIEKLQTLKAAISGEEIDYERKGVDEEQYLPECLFLFNCNEAPRFSSGLEAIETRWAILRFTKTYKMKPNLKQGELQADPRFKEDTNFVREKIAPAFLNLLIKELEDIAITGIDYSPAAQNFEEIRQESCHLYRFCHDVGLEASVGGRVFISDLWELLRDWYIKEGTLEVEYSDKGKEKLIWHDQANKYDNNVKASNQIYKRFSELFPKIGRGHETQAEGSKNKAYLSNVAIIASPASLPLREGDAASPTASPEKLSEAVGEAASIGKQGGEASEAICPTSLPELIEYLKTLPYSQKIKIINSLALPGMPVNISEKVEPEERIVLPPEEDYTPVSPDNPLKVGDRVILRKNRREYRVDKLYGWTHVSLRAIVEIGDYWDKAYVTTQECDPIAT